MDVAYSIASPIPGSGISHTASQAISALKEKGWLKQLLSLSNIAIPTNDPIVKDHAFDAVASMYIQPTDIFHGWANHSLIQLRQAKKTNEQCITIIERASSHVLLQNQILIYECEHFGIKTDPIHPWAIKKMLLEYKEADFVATPSKFTVNSFLRYKYPKEKILYLPYGVDTKKFVPKPIEHDKFTAIFVGQNWIRKNLYRVEKAWSTLNLKNSKLLVRCDAPVFKEMDYKKIEVVKWADSIQDFYNSCDIMIMPSLEEGRCLAVMEAMSSGIPVIISKNTGIEITDGKEGFYVNPYEVGEIQKKLTYFYDNRAEIKRMGKEARKYAERNTWKDYQKSLVDAYKKIVE